jgi:4'-phosphopantetheinyl transferase
VLHDLLAPDERARAEQMRFARDSRRFIAGRGMLRRTLAATANCHPAKLRIAAGPQGKPYLPYYPELRFNAAGSGGVGLVATTISLELGVDLELDEPRLQGLDVARRFFAVREVEALEALPPTERPAAFLRCWTRKEAYLKALGIGLHADLNSFEVSLAPNEPAELRWSAAPAECERWTLVDCSALIGGINSAVCFERRNGVQIRMVGAGT